MSSVPDAQCFLDGLKNITGLLRGICFTEDMGVFSLEVIGINVFFI